MFEYQQLVTKTETDVLGIEDGKYELEEPVYNIFKKQLERPLEGSQGNSFLWTAVKTNLKLKISGSIKQL